MLEVYKNMLCMSYIINSFVYCDIFFYWFNGVLLEEACCEILCDFVHMLKFLEWNSFDSWKEGPLFMIPDLWNNMTMTFHTGNRHSVDIVDHLNSI